MKEELKMKEVKNNLWQVFFEWCQKSDGRKILEILKSLEIKEDGETLIENCLEKVAIYLQEKERQMTTEEFFAILIRIVFVFFMAIKASENMLYLILFSLFPQELRSKRTSEIVKILEEKFIERVEEVAKIGGEEKIKDVIFKFLFIDNEELVLMFFSEAFRVTKLFEEKKDCLIG
jgi:hypothetical protein